MKVFRIENFEMRLKSSECRRAPRLKRIAIAATLAYMMVFMNICQAHEQEAISQTVT